MTRISDLLGKNAASLLDHRCKTIDKSALHLPGPDFVDRVVAHQRPPHPGPAQPAVDLQPRPPGRHRLPVDPPGRSGHRAQRRRLVRAQPALLRSGEHRPPGHRGRLQRRRHHARRARRRGAQVRAQDPVPAQAQPQRAADLPEQVRPDHVRARPAGRRHGLRRGRRDHLLRLGGVRPPDPGRSARRSRPRTSSAWRPCCGATCATTPSRRTASTTTSPPTSRARRTTSA